MTYYERNKERLREYQREYIRKNKKKVSIAHRKWYQENGKEYCIKNKEKISRQAKEGRNRRRDILKKRAADLLGGKCCKCGYKKCIQALEFHHKDEKKKEFSISNSLRSMQSWEKIEEEIKKCILLCANCHRELHAKNNWGFGVK